MAVIRRDKELPAVMKPTRTNDQHTQLTVRAERWLLGTCRCKFAFRELASICGEIPDAIGWKNGIDTHLVECKVSHSDFLSDKKKSFRKVPNMGMGVYRWMMSPKGLIKPDELPENWGLLYCHPQRVQCVVKAKPQERNWRAEMTLMASALRRVELRGDLKKIYDPETLKSPGHNNDQ